MKAITCSQCGALIGDISLEKRFARCDYCGAKFRPANESVFEISREEARKVTREFKKTHPPIKGPRLKPEPEETNPHLALTIILQFIFLFVLPVGAFILLLFFL